MVRRGLLLIAAMLGTLFFVPTAAQAACHAFEVSAKPATVAEGAKVTVTVSRDGNVAPSQVDVSSVDGSAKAGHDYPPVDRTVTFTSELSESFSIAITDDSATEPAETFEIRLSNPGGCFGSGYVVGSDATVKIAASDPASTTTTQKPSSTTSTAAPAATVTGASTTEADSTTSTSSAATTTSTGEESTTTSVPTRGTVVAFREPAEGGLGRGAIVLGAIGFAVAIGGATYAVRRHGRL